jgi:hypothetical protein
MYFNESARENTLKLPKNSVRAILTLCILSIILLHNGCTVRSALKDRKGVDISGIKTGVSKVEVEDILGPPEREWLTSSGICYRVYVHDLGVREDEIAGLALMDVLTFGAWEIFNVYEPYPPKRNSKKMAVSYDFQDMVVGIFDYYEDFDELPIDGKSSK